MKLGDLIRHLDPVRWHGDPDREIGAVSRDTREVDAHTAFVAIEGARIDGHDLVAGLTEVGAVLLTREVEVPAGVPWVLVKDGREALARASAAVEGSPASRMPVVGVTGTNGKTTITTLLQQLVEGCGQVAGRIGTTGVEVGGRVFPASLTTPEAPVLQRWLRQMLEAGASVVAMEVSSIGLVQRRVDGIPFALGVFTNLSHDHLDFHGTMEAYGEAKSRLFTELLRPVGGAPRALVCLDDPAWIRMHPPEDRWSYGFDPRADVSIAALELGAEGMSLALRHPGGTHEVRAPLIGRHNAQNLAAAFACGLLLGHDPDQLAAACAGAFGAVGRLQPVPNRHGLTVVVDYAHSPDALEAAIASMRATVSGALWVVFGCGGDRDRAKRPEMGRVALSADHVVLTSDNPRSERAEQIAADVLAGMVGARVRVELDRREAIMAAIAGAKPGDGVLIAGKGHETTQEIAGVFHPFNDRDVARAALEAR
jgi:UDP-N-acetylmuramoyl-L-alanyl-D-glutamate--2,6-diaminopimelate ligase